MPSGVEHFASALTTDGALGLIAASMPSGVEHLWVPSASPLVDVA